MAKTLKIDWVGYDAVRYAVRHWHYSKSVPAGKMLKFGVWEDERFIGVVIFGRGATPNLPKPYGLRQDECCELLRIALRDHDTPVTRIVAICIKMLKKANPGLRLIVSFADQYHGHHGGIYQGGNWIYAGEGNPHTFFKINGKLTHPRTLTSRGRLANLEGARTLDKRATAVTVPGKYRYLMPLDDDMRRRVAHMAQPYPKRAKQAMEGDQPSQRRGSTDLHAPLPNP